MATDDDLTDVPDMPDELPEEGARARGMDPVVFLIALGVGWVIGGAIERGRCDLRGLP